MAVNSGVKIHPTAVVGKNVVLGENVIIEPYAVLEGDSVIGDNTLIGAHAYIGKNTKIGNNCKIYNGASVGTDPQDLKFKGEETELIIGDNTMIREFCTINRGTAARGYTKIGDNCALLAYCHVAHDCVIGNNVVASNNLALAGHVEVGDNVTFGGIVSVHQFVRIGDHAFIGANSYIVKDIIPFALCAVGEKGVERIVGINKVGLERRGFDSDRRMKIRRAYKDLFKSGKILKEAIEDLAQKYKGDSDIEKIIKFVRDSQRSIYTME